MSIEIISYNEIQRLRLNKNLFTSMTFFFLKYILDLFFILSSSQIKWHLVE